MMDTQHLKAFLLVAETGSFSIAADKLHLTQPAVSKRIAALETQLDAMLFDRIGKSVSLTEAGLALLPHAQIISRDIENAKRTVSELSGVVAGKLSMATSHHIGLHRLPRVLRQFSQAYPQVQLDIEFMDSEKAYELIMKGKVELAVVTLAPVIDSSFHAASVWTDPLHIAIADNHPLAKHQTIELQQLSAYPAILPDLNTYTGRIVKKLFQDHGLTLNISMSTNYLETIKMMVTIGLGWSILPATMLEAPLRSIPLKEIQLERQLGHIYHRSRSLSNAAQAFITTLENNR